MASNGLVANKTSRWAGLCGVQGRGYPYVTGEIFLAFWPKTTLSSALIFHRIDGMGMYRTFQHKVYQMTIWGGDLSLVAVTTGHLAGPKLRIRVVKRLSAAADFCGEPRELV